MSKRFQPAARSKCYLLPLSVQDWLPVDHLARFIADVAAQLDLSEIYSS